MTRLSRRDLLKRVGAAGAGALATPAIGRAGISPSVSPAQTPNAPIVIGDRPVELIITPVSAATARITLAPVSSDRETDISAPAFSIDGSLVARTWPAPAARFTTLAERRTVPCGELTVIAAPRDVRQAGVTAVGVQIRAADGRAPFTLRVDERTGAVTFSLGGGAILGLGEGGPQFDRRGSTDRMRSGQGGYQLRTHGGRVPVQWMIGTGGWAMFIHRPLGTFDFTGPDARFDAGDRDALPIDVFVVGARDPAGMMAEYARPDRLPGAAAALGVRVSAIAPHARQPRGALAGSADVPREEAAVRDADLPRHRLLSLGLEHGQRRVHVQPEGLPGSEGR